MAGSSTYLGVYKRDADDAKAAYEAVNTQFARRVYARSVFAFIEAVAHWMKSLALERPARFSNGELALLKDESYSVSESGEVYSQPRFLRTPENLRFATACLSRVLPSTPPLPIKGPEWRAFRDALTVRHRITHPKHHHDPDISDREMAVLIETHQWFLVWTTSLAQKRLRVIGARKRRLERKMKKHTRLAKNLRRRINRAVAKLEAAQNTSSKEGGAA